MKKYILILILFIINITGCMLFYSSNKVNDSYCYENQNTGLDTMLNLNGYYFLSDTIDIKNRNFKKSCINNYALFLYEDGFFAQSFYNKNMIYDEKDLNWGLYKISGDTLKVKFIASGTKKWRRLGIAWYIIKDKNTIEALFFRYNGIVPNNFFLDSANIKKHYAKFVTSDVIPEADKAKVKKDKYFWCNKEQYKEWKKEQKIKKHKGK